MRTDEQIIDETNELARYLLAELIGTGYQVPEGHKFYEADDPRSKAAWEHAVRIMEMTTKTEMADVLATLEEEQAYVVQLRAIKHLTVEIEVKASSMTSARQVALREANTVGWDPSEPEDVRIESVYPSRPTE